jgi:L-asparaginase
VERHISRSDGERVTRLNIYTTGGTIASRYSEELQGFTTAVTGEELVDAVPGLSEVADVRVAELDNVSSTFLRPSQVFEWACRIRADLEDPEVLGAVVTHGTDTLEESAYLFDLVLTTSKPVVFTAAMRTPSELVSDGARNLLCASRVAVHSDARDKGVLVLMNEQIHAASDVTKSNAESIASFVSPNWGPLGHVSRRWGEDTITIGRGVVRTDSVPAQRIEEKVAYIKTVMGSDGFLLDAAVDAGARGLVIEAFGGGEVTPYMAPAIQRARSLGVPIVVSTRCFSGRPLDLYADLGEGLWLTEQGVKLAGYLSGPKARIRLMLVLGLDQPDAVDTYFPAYNKDNGG